VTDRCSGVANAPGLTVAFYWQLLSTHPSRCTDAAAVMTLFTDIYHLCYHIRSQDTISTQRWQI